MLIACRQDWPWRRRIGAAFRSLGFSSLRVMKQSFPARLGLAVALLALAAGPVRAEGEENELSAVEQQLQLSKAEQDRITAEILAAEEEQQEISEKLVDISQRIQAQEAAITDSEGQLLKMNKEEVVILSNLAAKQDVLSELLAGLQRLEQNPPPALVVEPNDVLGALRGAIMFGAIVPELREEAEELASDLARLEELRGNVKKGKETLRADIARLKDSRRELDGLIAKKRDLVASANARLETERARTAELATKAKTLKQLLASLAEDKQRRDAEDAKKAKAEELARKKAKDAVEQPRLAFAKARGKLAYPAQGQILKRFGDDDGLGGHLRGLVIATRESAQVTAPADGRVEFAGPFRSYGQVMIVNPGSGYHLLLAGMGKMTAQTGDYVRAGEPVGEMGTGPSSVTLLGDVIQDRRPVLYIEFRNSTEAIDSTPWWIGGRQEARR
jgi:murein hydrolase activator